MKFFEKSNKNKKETLPLSEAENKEILSIYEKTGLQSIYLEAFQKLHEGMQQFRDKMIAEGKPIEEATKIVAAAEEKARIKILEQGNRDYVETAKKLIKESNGGTSSSPSSS